MIFPACINLPASSHYKGMYAHGSPILWYIRIFLDVCLQIHELSYITVSGHSAFFYNVMLEDSIFVVSLYMKVLSI